MTVTKGQQPPLSVIIIIISSSSCGSTDACSRGTPDCNPSSRLAG